MRICVFCKNPDNDDDAAYCSNCGFELNSNYCTNEFCALNNGCHLPLAEDACYCDCCGSETEYYVAGLIEPKSFN